MIVIDTHVLVWAMQDDPKLGPLARSSLETAAASEALGVSAITPWEIALLAERGRLILSREAGLWIELALGRSGVTLLALTPAIAVDSVRLPAPFHADPADRIIVATARNFGAPLLTADRAILDYGRTGHVSVQDARM